MGLISRIRKIYQLRDEHELKKRVFEIVNCPSSSNEIAKELNKIAEEHNNLVFWPMKKIKHIIISQGLQLFLD